MNGEHSATDGIFAAEVERLRRGGALGESGRLLELFAFLAARGEEAVPATQAEIAEAVFGQTETSVDDATVRVYIHRLRKRLEEHYAADGDAGRAQLTIPPGAYALRLRRGADEESTLERRRTRRFHLPLPALVAAVAVLIAGAFVLGRGFAPAEAPPANALWRPFIESDRPIVLVVGDYYLFGEIDPIRPEQSRLIRDFRVDSPMDLLLMQEAEPERYGNAEDVGLTYLPLSTAYGLRHIVPILARGGRTVRVVAASELDPEMLRGANVVYIGLIGAMGLLEETTFDGSGFEIGETYDELIDRASRQSYTSEEARRLALPVFYRDYGYVARFRAPGGSLIAVIASERETALRGLAPVVASNELPSEFAGLARGDDGFEALFQITGQQGADMSERLLIARVRQ